MGFTQSQVSVFKIMENTEEKEMNAEYDQVIRNQEIQNIKDSQDAIKDVQWWKKHLNIAGCILYAIGCFIWIIQDNEKAAFILFIAFTILVFTATVLQWKILSRRKITQDLLDAFNRKNALPLYHSMLEKFADQPYLHIHLSNDGTIVISDRRKENK